MYKLQFYIPFNVNINILNCSEISKSKWCSLMQEYLSKEFTYLLFIHTPTQHFKCDMKIDRVYLDGVIINLSSNEICGVDETTLSIISDEIKEKYIPQLNEMLAKKSNNFTTLPTTARFTVLAMAEYNNIKIDDSAWKSTEGSLITGTVDSKLIQCVPSIDFYKEEVYNV